MMQLKHLGLCVAAGFSMNAMAADFSFDRPGSGIGTGITPVGQLAWEQGLANAHYTESTTVDGDMSLKFGNDYSSPSTFKINTFKSISCSIGFSQYIHNNI